MKKYMLLATTVLVSGLMMAGESRADTADSAPQSGSPSSPAIHAENITTSQALEAGDPVDDESARNPRLAIQRFIQHVNYARVALAMKNGQLADKNISQAGSMLALLKSASANDRAISHVETGRVLYDGSTAGSRYHYYPIESGPINVETVDTGPFWARSEGISVTDADVVYVTIDLGDDRADKYLASARAAIGQKKFAAADKDLADLTDAVVKIDNEVSLPVLKARDNIALARDFILRRNYSGARYALTHADDALDAMSKDERYKGNQPQIVAMRAEIDDMQGDIEKKDPTMMQKASLTMSKWSKDIGQWIDPKNQ